MTDINKLEELAKAALKSAPGEWARDCQDSEGAYGSGPDARHGFRVPVLYVGGKQVLTADGSEIALICEECDEDGGSAWDDTSMDVVDYIAAANPAEILSLISQYRRMEEALRPFAAAADDLSENHWDHLEVWESPAAGLINGGHLRAARQALQDQDQ